MPTTIKNRCSDEEYECMFGERASHLKKCEHEGDPLRQIKMPSFRELVLAPEENTKEAFINGHCVDERVLMQDKSRWEGLTRRATAGSYKTTRQRVIGQCQSSMRLLRSEYGPDWREHALVQFAIQSEVETDYGILPTKMKGDLWLGDYVDLKTTSFPRSIVGECDKWGYDISACHYLYHMNAAGVSVERYRLLFVDSKFPFNARFWDMPEWMIEAAVPRWQKCCENVARGLSRGEWTLPQDDTADYERPAWHAFKYDSEVQIVGYEEESYGEE